MSNEAIEYHSKDFEWDKLRQKIENDPSLVYHLLPFEDGIDNHNPYSSSLHLQDSDAWNKFYTRHSTGKFFKIFTLSTVPPFRMPRAISECFSVLKPGGLLLFRDYGLYDMTMLRFESNQKVGFREYKRSDGTRSYFFSLDSVRALFTDVGFTELELEYCCIKSLNRGNGKTMQRVWVHAKYQKPIQCYSPK